MTQPEPPTASRAADRAHAFGNELITIHNWLRGELVRVAAELDDYIAGGAPPAHLQAHCLAFCQALTDHHRSEDHTAFPALARQYPELTPVLAGLSEDHEFISGILERMRALLTSVTAATAHDVRSEMAGLSAIMESHFQWEERRIVAALDQLASHNHSSTKLFGLNPADITSHSGGSSKKSF